MKYQCGTKVRLGDEIMVGYGPGQESLARVVAIGTDLVINRIDQGFYSWAKSTGVIDKNSVVVEWIDADPPIANGP